MTIKEVRTGIEYLVNVEPVSDADFKAISVKRHSFSWRKEKEFNVVKLCLAGSADIKGLMSLNFFDSEQRVEIRLLASSIENVGPGKIFGGIASCLIAFACRQAIVRYTNNACVSLVPKTKLREHYVNEYGMVNAGKSLCLYGQSLMDLIKKHKL